MAAVEEKTGDAIRAMELSDCFLEITSLSLCSREEKRLAYSKFVSLFTFVDLLHSPSQAQAERKNKTSKFHEL